MKFIATELQQSMSGRKVIIGTKGFLKTEKEQNKLILTQRVSTQWKKKNNSGMTLLRGNKHGNW